MAEAAVQQQKPKAVDLILNCSICQDTLSAIYATPDSRHGLQQNPHRGTGSNSDGSITKLWLTECAHITCGKHLEGGGVPFHPENEPPKAPCPLCSRDNQDSSAKILFAIRGVSKGQYDENIPQEYLQVPPPQLGLSGNEALRFQYVSLLRFASKMHEKLSSSEKELNTWRDREKSIVKCLAATESLGRVLQIARDQLLELGADVSAIDNVLHVSASLNGTSTVATGKESNSTTDDSHTIFGDQHSPAGSLLARGSAADLQIIQDNVLQLQGQDLPRVAEMNGLQSSRTLKRKRLDTTENLAISYQHNLDSNERQQRLSSRDAMPPPAQLLQDTSWTKLSRPAASRQFRSIDHSPARRDDYGEEAVGDNYNRPNGQRPMFNGAKPMTEDRSHGMFAPTASYFREWHADDGELDRNFRFSAPSRLESRLAGLSPSRLTLPPSTPSVVNYATPRRLGISANARTSQPPLPTPKNSRSPQRQVSQHPSTQGDAPAASPFFSSRSLATGRDAPSPYVNRPPQQVAQPNARSHSTVNPLLHAPSAAAPWKRAWLTAPCKQGQRESQSRQGSSTEQLQNGSGAYRQPGGHRQSNNDQQPSINSFSFTNQPQIEHVIGGRSSRAPLASHGRRPARR